MSPLVQVAIFDTVMQNFGGGAALLNLHDRMADTLLAAAALSAEGPGGPCLPRALAHRLFAGFSSPTALNVMHSRHSLRIPPAETALRLEQRGLALAWSVLRFAYSAGGDGNSDVRFDARNLAAFVRDPAALVTCLLLPHSCSARLEMQVRPGPAFVAGWALSSSWLSSSPHCY